jgi:microsomal epoxide hydrolase
MPSIRTFRCEVPDSAVAELHQRLDLTRWPDQLDDVGWSFGVDKNYLQELVHYWRHTFDWRAAEAQLNGFAQYLVEIDGIDTHFIHERSPHPDATPLILTHGWPGSVWEFFEVIPRLTQPEKFGGRPEDAFHVVCPSLPGFGFSGTVRDINMGMGVTARRHARLMAILGYSHYYAQGGDIGSGVSRLMPVVDPEHCAAMHINLVAMAPPKDLADPMAVVTPAERERMRHTEEHQREGRGYQILQNTRPQTLAYALHDSPAGWCAWVTEKFCTWADCDGDIRNVVSWDRMLGNISLYWFTNTIASSLRFYRQNTLAHASGANPFAAVTAPSGVALYPREIYQAPRAWVEREFALVHWSEAAKGGHFAAMEQPQYFAEDLWRFKLAVAERLG